MTNVFIVFQNLQFFIYIILFMPCNSPTVSNVCVLGNLLFLEKDYLELFWFAILIFNFLNYKL